MIVDGKKKKKKKERLRRDSKTEIAVSGLLREGGKERINGEEKTALGGETGKGGSEKILWPAWPQR